MGTSINRGVKLTTGRSTFLDRDAFRNSSIWVMEGNAGPWAVANPVGPTDPDYASVTFHLPLQSDLLDTKGHTITANGGGGGPALDGSESPYAGGDSAVFASASTQYLSAADSADFEMGTGDFTIDLWARLSTLGASRTFISKSINNIAANGPYVMQTNTSNLPQYLLANQALTGGSGFFYNFFSTALSVATWYHLSIVRSGTNVYSFRDGVLVNTAAIGVQTLHDNGADLLIGSILHSSGIINPMNGHIADVRITKGVARYTSTFTPPTTAYPTQ